MNSTLKKIRTVESLIGRLFVGYTVPNKKLYHMPARRISFYL